jgi:hypothetical protein
MFYSVQTYNNYIIKATENKLRVVLYGVCLSIQCTLCQKNQLQGVVKK